MSTGMPDNPNAVPLVGAPVTQFSNHVQPQTNCFVERQHRWDGFRPVRKTESSTMLKSVHGTA